MDESFESLEQKLELLIETSRQVNHRFAHGVAVQFCELLFWLQLGIMVTDIQPNTQSALNQKIQTLATCLKDLDASKDNFKEVFVPMQVFE